MPTLFHVTATANRDSIKRHGLDWTRMGPTLGVAGSRCPEVDGVFLCRDQGEVDFFCRMNANGEPVDVWAVDGVRDADLVEAAEGFVYLPQPIPAGHLTLVESMRLPAPAGKTRRASTAYQSTLTITLSDGRVLHDAEAHEWARRSMPTAKQAPDRHLTPDIQ